MQIKCIEKGNNDMIEKTLTGIITGALFYNDEIVIKLKTKIAEHIIPMDKCFSSEVSSFMYKHLEVKREINIHFTTDVGTDELCACAISIGDDEFLDQEPND